MASRYWVGFAVSVMITVAGCPAASENSQTREEILAALAGIQTAEGVLVRKMRTPIAFTMGPVGGNDPKYAGDIAFFKELDREVRAFLSETLKGRYLSDDPVPPIQVTIVFPDYWKESGDAHLDKLLRFGDGVVRDRKHGDYYLMECSNLVQNLKDPYNDETPPSDGFSVELAGADSLELTARGANYDRDLLTRCLYRHILAGLGLRGEVPAGQESVLSKENPAVRPTGFDRWMVETLYRSDARAGEKIDIALPGAAVPTP